MVSIGKYEIGSGGFSMPEKWLYDKLGLNDVYIDAEGDYDDYARRLLKDRKTDDDSWLASDKVSYRDPGEGVLKRHYIGTEMVDRPDLYIADNERDPRGTQADPQFKLARKHTEDRASLLTGNMLDSWNQSITEANWSAQSQMKMRQQIMESDKKTLKIFTRGRENIHRGTKSSPQLYVDNAIKQFESGESVENLHSNTNLKPSKVRQDFDTDIEGLSIESYSQCIGTGLKPTSGAPRSYSTEELHESKENVHRLLKTIRSVTRIDTKQDQQFGDHIQTQVRHQIKMCALRLNNQAAQTSQTHDIPEEIESAKHRQLKRPEIATCRYLKFEDLDDQIENTKHRSIGKPKYSKWDKYTITDYDKEEQIDNIPLKQQLNLKQTKTHRNNTQSQFDEDSKEVMHYSGLKPKMYKQNGKSLDDTAWSTERESANNVHRRSKFIGYKTGTNVIDGFYETRDTNMCGGRGSGFKGKKINPQLMGVNTVEFKEFKDRL